MSTEFDVIKLRRATAAEWAAFNPIPEQGEPCYETDTHVLRIGTGVDHYNDLSGFNSGTVYTDLDNDYEIDPITGIAIPAYTQETIEAALTAIGTSTKVSLLIAPGTWVMDSNTVNATTPLAGDYSAYTNVTWHIVPGAVLQIETGITITIGGPLEAGLYQIFDCQNTGKVVFGGGSVKEVYPEWWGANVSPGATDMIVPISKALLSQEGGILQMLDTDYKVTDEITITSGWTVRGMGCADRYYGIPTGTEKRTYLYQSTASKAVFFIGENTRDWQIGNMCLGANSTSGSASANKTGIRMAGDYPNSSVRFTIDHVTFYDFSKAISVEQGATVDWQCDAARIIQCNFFNNTIGVYINSLNADLWHLDTCGFAIPAGGDGIYLQRGPLILIENCSGGGLANNANDFLHIGEYYDHIHLIGCQAEALESCIHLDSQAGYENSIFAIYSDCCAWEAQVMLERQARYVSKCTRHTASVYCQGNNSIVESDGDTFDGGGGYSLTGSDIQMTRAPIPYNRTYAGDPNNNITPFFIGEEALDTTNGIWYKAINVTGTGWRALNV